MANKVPYHMYCEEQQKLEQVLTVSEAASSFGYSERRIRQLCSEGLVSARFAAGTWLIWSDSMVRYVYLWSNAS